MSRYDTPTGEHSEFEPGSDKRVLRNTRGITDPEEAERVETELLTRAYIDSFEWVTTSLQFTAELLCEMHRLWLANLYPMAGSYRQVNVSKNGFLFCPASNIGAEMERFEKEQLAEHTPCLDHQSVNEVAYKVSVVHAELLLIHPFREGNGRLGRWLADLMILQAGYAAPDYDLDTNDKLEVYFSAMRKAYSGDFTDLTALFATWIASAQ